MKLSNSFCVMEIIQLETLTARVVMLKILMTMRHSVRATFLMATQLVEVCI